MPLTQEQFQKAISAGFSTEQIIGFEKKRLSESETATLEETPVETKPKSNLKGSISEYFLPTWITKKTPEFEKASRESDRDILNFWGDIGNRPGAIIRSTLQGKGWQQGALKPTETPKFQDITSQKYWETSEKASERFTPSQKAVHNILMQPGGMLASASGMAADIATNPLDVILGLFPVTKTGKATMEAVAKTKPAQAIGRFMAKERHLPSFTKFTDEVLIGQSTKISGVADDVMKNMDNEIADFYSYDKGVGSTNVSPDNIKDAMQNYLKGDTKEEAELLLENLKKVLGKEAKPNINTAFKIKQLAQQDIPESIWMKGKKGFNLTPSQNRKVQAYFKLDKAIKQALQGTEDLQYLEYLNKKATEGYRVGKTIKRMVIDPTGEPSETSHLINAFMGDPRQAGKRQLFRRLGQLDENANEVINTMNKFRRRQTLKKVGKTVTGGYGIYELGRRIFGK